MPNFYFLYPQFTCTIFIYSQSFIHHFTGLYGTNIMTNSQLACQLSWQSAAPVSQRSWVQIPYRPEFFSGLIFTTAQVVFITAKIAFIYRKSSHGVQSLIKMHVPRFGNKLNKEVCRRFIFENLFNSLYLQVRL